jgi:hypothetical protein
LSFEKLQDQAFRVGEGNCGSSDRLSHFCYAIGNVLRRDYENMAPIMWKLAQADLPALEKVCREELKAEQSRD